MSRSLLVEADGGSRGNPGVAGYGALVRDAETGQVLAERAEPLGKATNNVAEYSGLVAGLRAVEDIGLGEGADIDVRMDSQLVIQQMTGAWKIKHEDMRRLALDAQRVVARLRDAGARVRFTWVPRERNKAADALSNDAMDGQTICRDHVGETEDPGRYVGDMGSVVEEAAELRASEEAAPAPVLPALPEMPVPDLSAGTRVLLVRHGVTDFTDEHRLDGRGGADPVLNARGHAQAQEAAERVRRRVPDGRVTVLSGALRRQQQTAAPIAAALGVEVLVDDAFDEQSFGQWDGRSVADLSASEGELLARMRTAKDVSVPGGESYRALAHRVASGLARARAHGGTVVVVTSRRPVLTILADLLGLSPEQAWMFAVDPCSVTEVTWWADGNAVIGAVNDAP